MPPSDGHRGSSQIGSGCQHGAAWLRDSQSLRSGHPLPVLKTAVAKIFQVRHQQKKVFQDLGIRATDPEIPGLAKQREAGCPGAR